MRNLKRMLSLALASVMLLGMMVVGTSAASFPDVTSENNVEAIEVIKAVGIMEGNEKGEFEPAKAVTRNEMAVVMANMMDLKADDFAGTCKFTDVPDWAKNFVAACYANGIVSGTGATTYSGDSTVTAAEAGLMMMKALGYFQNAEDFGEDWKLATVKKAAEIELYDGVSVGADTALTRNGVAQIALTTLKSDIVKFTGTKGTNITTSDGTVINMGYTEKYDAITLASEGGNNYAGSTAGDAGLGTKQLCEDLYGTDLKLDSSATDGMSREAKSWTYKSDTVGTYAKSADTSKVIAKEKTVAEIIKDINKNYTTANTDVYVNGVGKNLTDTVKVGSVVELFVDNKAVETACVTEYSVSKITGVAVSKGSEEDDDLQVRIPGLVGYTDIDKVNGNYAELAKGDRVYYYVDANGVYTFAKAGSFEGKLTGSVTGTPTKYTISGTSYVVNGNTATITGVTADPDYHITYTYFTDANGYLIDAEAVETAQAKDYVVIQAISYANGGGGLTASQKVEARLVKMDGSAEVVEVETVKLGPTPTAYTATTTGSPEGNYLAYNTASAGAVNTAVTAKVGKAFFTYSKNSDDEYTLVEVVANSADSITVGTMANTNDIETGDTTIAGSGPAVNNSTLFIVANESAGKVFTTYTGKDNVPNVTDPTVGAYIAKSGIATYVYVDAYTSTSIDGDSIYVMDTTAVSQDSVEDEDGARSFFNTYKAIVDGKSTTVKMKADSDGVLDANVIVSLAIGLYTPTYKDDVITKLATKDTDVGKANSYTLSDGTLVTGNSTFTTNAGIYSYTGDELIFVMDEDGNVTEGAIADIDEDDNDDIYVIQTNASDKKVDYLFIVEQDDDDVSLSALAGDNSLPALNKASKDQTVTGAASTAYTITATANGVGATVKFSQTNSGSDWTAADGTVNKVTTGEAGTAAKTIWVQVKSVDDTVAIYKLTINAPAQ